MPDDALAERGLLRRHAADPISHENVPRHLDHHAHQPYSKKLREGTASHLKGRVAIRLEKSAAFSCNAAASVVLRVVLLSVRWATRRTVEDADSHPSIVHEGVCNGDIDLDTAMIVEERHRHLNPRSKILVRETHNVHYE